jgi:transposase, IS5 family
MCWCSTARVDAPAPANGGKRSFRRWLQESLAVATRTQAMKAVQPRPCCDRHDGAAEGSDVPDRCQAAHRACERLVRLAKKLGVSLRQFYRRVGKLALIKHQRYAHAHQFKRAHRACVSSRLILAASSVTSSGASPGRKICGRRSCGVAPHHW